MWQHEVRYVCRRDASLKKTNYRISDEIVNKLRNAIVMELNDDFMNNK